MTRQHCGVSSGEEPAGDLTVGLLRCEMDIGSRVVVGECGGGGGEGGVGQEYMLEGAVLERRNAFEVSESLL